MRCRLLRDDKHFTAGFLTTGLAVSIFRDNSTRTSVSPTPALQICSVSTVQELDEKKSQIAHGETVQRNCMYDLIFSLRQ